MGQSRNCEYLGLLSSGGPAPSSRPTHNYFFTRLLSKKRGGKNRPFEIKRQNQPNWFMVLSLPPAFRAASPAKYSL